MAVELDQQLLELLACPCPEHAPLRAGTAADPQADFLTCTSCGRSFPVRDGIPVLLLEEAVSVGDTSHRAADGSAAGEDARNGQ